MIFTESTFLKNSIIIILSFFFLFLMSVVVILLLYFHSFSVSSFGLDIVSVQNDNVDHANTDELWCYTLYIIYLESFFQEVPHVCSKQY